MNNLKQYKLSSIIEIISGGTPKTSISEYWGGKIPWLSVKDFNNDDKKVYKSEKYITIDGLNNSATRLLDEKDIIISARGTVGEIAQIGRKMAFNQSCYGLRAKGSFVTPDYLYYLLKKEISQIRQSVHGSVFDTITRDTFNNIKVDLPPLPTQRRIADILSALDDKIENNRKTSEKLEQIAQSIFKQWFVDFDFPNAQGQPYKSSGGRLVESELGLIPEGWEVVPLNKIVDNVKDTCNPSDTKDLPYLPIDVIPKFQLGIDKYDNWENAKSSLIKFNEDDIIIGAMRIYFHRVVISPFKGLTRSTCIILRAKNTNDRIFSLFHVNQDNFIDWASNNSKGSTMPYAFWNNGIETFKLALPPLALRKEFETIITPLIQIIKSNYKNKLTLQQTRDTLLPKLMSGEIEV